MSHQNLHNELLVFHGFVSSWTVFILENLEGFYFQKVLCRGITLNACSQIINLEDFLQEEEEIQQFLGKNVFEYLYVERYHFTVDLPWIIIYLNIERVPLLIRFLENICIGIEVNNGQRPTVIEVL